MAKKLRFKVGNRVTCARGVCIGSSGRIVRRAPADSITDWVVRLDMPTKLGSATLHEVWFDDGELEPLAAPKPKRRFKVGCRVTLAAGVWAGAVGRIREPTPRELWARVHWVVVLDDTGIVHLVSDGDLRPYAVPPEARPLSVGALHHSEVRLGL